MRPKSRMRLIMEAMKIGDIHTEPNAHVTDYWRAQSNAAAVKIATKQHFKVTYDRPAKTINVRRVA